MTNKRKDFTVFECVMVVAILLFVAGIAIQGWVHSVGVSEENTIHSAGADYLAVRNMYADQYRSAPVEVSSVNSTDASSDFNSPNR